MTNDRPEDNRTPAQTPDSGAKADPQAEADATKASRPSDTSEPDAPHPDPTRFGDWEKNGRCIDF